MPNFKIAFTKEDYQILESYKIMLEGLADYLGDGYEFVLHSLENLDKSVIKIINGHYTGRKEGSPITDLALAMLAKIEKTPNSDYISYFNRNKKGEPLKATTIAIKGSNDKIIGLLCINFYMNIPLHDVLKNFMPRVHTSNDKDVAETFTDNVDDLIKETLNEVRIKVTNDHTISSAGKNKEIINLLYQRGIFNIKDAVPKVADMLGISKNTVYMHMRNIK